MLATYLYAHDDEAVGKIDTHRIFTGPEPSEAEMRVEWHGVFTALVTPFTSEGALDEDGLKTLVNRQVGAGIHGLVPCGTTGESPALTEDEWARVIEITVREAKGKALVIAGSGTNNTAASARRTAKAKEIGVDGALVITPYYNKPTPFGLVRHYTEVAKAAPGLPIMVYNVPGRTGSNLTPDAFENLLAIEEVSAVKEAAGDLLQAWEYCRRFGNTVPIISGEDGMNLPLWEQGARGTVSVLSNLIPDKVVAQWKAFESGDYDTAYNYHKTFAELASILFIESSPGPAKYAMNQMGLPAGQVRMPLAPVLSQSEKAIDSVLNTMGLVR